jgi:glycosyltransferase involved in cell wall biosynthesis
MNIGIITSAPFPPEEGIGNYVYNLSKKLVKRGNRVTIITRGLKRTSWEKSIEGIEILKVPFVPIYPLHVGLHGLFVNAILRSLPEEFDFLHIHSPLSPFIETSLPIILTIHTPMMVDAKHIECNDFYSLVSRIVGRTVSYPLELKLLRRSDLITAVSNSVARDLQAYGISGCKIKVVGNGVDAKIFTPIRNRSKRQYILFTGRLSYRKGLFDLIECVRYVRDKFPDIPFVIVGKGPLLGRLIKKVEELSMKEAFIFLGYVDRQRLIKIYQEATLYVLPSHYEGLPTVLLEAMACGLPVVATAVSGNIDVISDGNNGILVPPRSPKKMADAICKLLSDVEFAELLGNNARRTILEHYSWDVVADRISSCYRSLGDL